MTAPLPHFGVIVDEIRKSLKFAFDDHETELSERTLRTISSGERVGPRSWNDFAATLIQSLTADGLFPLNQSDRVNLIKTFHGYRSSYEKLNDLLSTLPVAKEIIQRAVIRLSFLDLGIRYASISLWLEKMPSAELPLWAVKDGGNAFWKQAMSRKFPGLVYLDSKTPEGDCASSVKMNPSKMRRCLYENDRPELSALKIAFPDFVDLASAQRHYAAFHLVQQLAESFGRLEIEFLVKKMTLLARWLYRWIDPILKSFTPEKRLQMLKRILIGGIDEAIIKRMLREKLAVHIPPAFKTDLIALANGDTMSPINTYLEFCKYMGAAPARICWEEAFDLFQVEYADFFATGKLANGRNPSTKLQLTSFLHHAQAMNDPTGEESILKRIIADFPGDAEVHQLLAQLYQELGRLPEAWHQFEMAAKTDQNFILPLFSLAASKSQCGYHEDALRIIERIPKAGLGNGSRDFLMGECLVRMLRFGESISYLEAAFQQGWEPGEAAALLARAYDQLAHSRPDSHKQSQQWEKEARHRGVEMPNRTHTGIRNQNSINFPTV